MALSETGSRKRYRTNYEDEISEFTPLSKRINNLHINNAIFPLSKHLEQSDGKGDMHKSIIENNACIAEIHYGGQANVNGPDMSNPWGCQNYTPDMTQAENPFYYENNRLLYELYMERMQRIGGPPLI